MPLRLPRILCAARLVPQQSVAEVLKSDPLDLSEK